MNTKTHKKDFDGWNIQKKIIDGLENKKTFHEREVWFVKIGENVGFEVSQFCRRLDCLILKD